MGHSQAAKAGSRERILAAAAQQIREGGLDAVSVGSLMKSVNLTHGGFYGHFESRSELIAQALQRALVDSQTAAKPFVDRDRPRTFAGMVKQYLSAGHRDRRGNGCAIAALASDVGRADERSRAIMEEHIARFMEKVGGLLEDESGDSAIVAMSAMIGALALSRAMTDTKRADEVLNTVRNYLVEHFGPDET
jgi:TetR/AcrR family transcriptional repressor of nem operon